MWQGQLLLKNSIIRKTGQFWKVILAFTGIVLGWIGMIVALTSFGSKEGGIVVAVVCLVIALTSMLFVFISVRCPKCNSRWVWIAASKKDKSEWPYWFLKLEKCPTCGCCNDVHAT